MSKLQAELDRLKKDENVTANFAADSPNKGKQPPLQFTPSAIQTEETPMDHLRIAVQYMDPFGGLGLSTIFDDFAEACKHVSFSVDKRKGMERFNRDIVTPLKTFIQASKFDPKAELHLDARDELKNYLNEENLAQLQAAIARFFLWKLAEIGTESVKQFIKEVDTKLFAKMATGQFKDQEIINASQVVFSFYGTIMSQDPKANLKDLYKNICNFAKKSGIKGGWGAIRDHFKLSLIGGKATSNFVNFHSPEPKTPRQTAAGVMSPFTALFANNTPQSVFSPSVFDTPLKEAATAAQDKVASPKKGETVAPIENIMDYAARVMHKNDGFLEYALDLQLHRANATFKIDHEMSGPEKFDELINTLHTALTKGDLTKWIELVDKAEDTEKYLNKFDKLKMNIAQFIMRELKRKFDGSVTADIVDGVSAIYQQVKDDKSSLAHEDLSIIVFRLAKASLTPKLSAADQKIKSLEVFDYFLTLLGEDFELWQPLSELTASIFDDEATRASLKEKIKKFQHVDKLEDSAKAGKADDKTKVDTTPITTDAEPKIVEKSPVVTAVSAGTVETPATDPADALKPEQRQEQEPAKVTPATPEETSTPAEVPSPSTASTPTSTAVSEVVAVDSRNDSEDDPVGRISQLRELYVGEQDPAKKTDSLAGLLLELEADNDESLKFDIACEMLLDIATRYRYQDQTKPGQINFVALALYLKSVVAGAKPADMKDVSEFTFMLVQSAFLSKVDNWKSVFDTYMDDSGRDLQQYLESNAYLWNAVLNAIDNPAAANEEQHQSENAIKSLAIEGLGTAIPSSKRLQIAKDMNQELAQNIQKHGGDHTILDVAQLIYDRIDTGSVQENNIDNICDFTEWMVANTIVDSSVDLLDALTHYKVNDFTLSSYQKAFPDFWNDVLKVAAGLIDDDQARTEFLGQFPNLTTAVVENKAETGSKAEAGDFRDVPLSSEDDSDIPQHGPLTEKQLRKQENQSLLAGKKPANNEGDDSVVSTEVVLPNIFGADADVEAKYSDLTAPNALFSAPKTYWRIALDAMRATYYKTKNTTESRAPSVVVSDMEILANFKRVVDKDQALDKGQQKEATEKFIGLYNQYTSSKSKAWNRVGKAFLPIGALAVAAGVGFGIAFAFGAAILAVEAILAIAIVGGIIAGASGILIGKTTPNKGGRMLNQVRKNNKSLLAPPAPRSEAVELDDQRKEVAPVGGKK